MCNKKTIVPLLITLTLLFTLVLGAEEETKLSRAVELLSTVSVNTSVEELDALAITLGNAFGTEWIPAVFEKPFITPTSVQRLAFESDNKVFDETFSGVGGLQHIAFYYCFIRALREKADDATGERRFLTLFTVSTIAFYAKGYFRLFENRLSEEEVEYANNLQRRISDDYFSMSHLEMLEEMSSKLQFDGETTVSRLTEFDRQIQGEIPFVDVAARLHWFFSHFGLESVTGKKSIPECERHGYDFEKLVNNYLLSELIKLPLTNRTRSLLNLVCLTELIGAEMKGAHTAQRMRMFSLAFSKAADEFGSKCLLLLPRTFWESLERNSYPVNEFEKQKAELMTFSWRLSPLFTGKLEECWFATDITPPCEEGHIDRDECFVYPEVVPYFSYYAKVHHLLMMYFQNEHASGILESRTKWFDAEIISVFGEPPVINPVPSVNKKVDISLDYNYTREGFASILGPMRDKFFKGLVGVNPAAHSNERAFEFCSPRVFLKYTNVPYTLYCIQHISVDTRAYGYKRPVFFLVAYPEGEAQLEEVFAGITYKCESKGGSKFIDAHEQLVGRSFGINKIDWFSLLGPLGTTPHDLENGGYSPSIKDFLEKMLIVERKLTATMDERWKLFTDYDAKVMSGELPYEPGKDVGMVFDFGFEEHK